MNKYCYEYSCRLGIRLSLISEEYKDFIFQVKQNKYSNELLVEVTHKENKGQKHFYLINGQNYEPFNEEVLSNIRDYCKQS